MQVTGRFKAGMLLLALLTICQPAKARSPTQFLVFFDQFSANLVPSAKNIIAQAAAKSLRLHPKSIRIEARANATGSPDATMKIAETRAVVVRDQLVTDGVPAGILYLVPIGQAGTKDTSVAPRRVNIILIN